MSDLEVRQLRYFVAVAEELHFGRAAERLGMAQPPLSRAIRDLERQLGVQLLVRTTRQVTLTSAGEVLLRDGRAVLDAVKAAERRAQHAGNPEPSLRLALKADYDAGLLPKILALYEQDDAAIPVSVQLGGRGEQPPALREGRADVALLPLPFDDRDLDFEPLVTEPRLVALPATDPLAARDTLCLADLDGLPQPDDLRPRRQLDIAQIFSLVELGRLVWFPPESVARRHVRPGIAYRPVIDISPSTLAVAWPRETRSPAVAAFVRAAMAVASDDIRADSRADPGKAPPVRDGSTVGRPLP
ncbi:LysR family transcriptional regulator [Kutzneria sp. CA-103260]|uniref:LysR family transcriptional regulator n=1 Tax=Kutzneria sp. CA-103260 TaxID=2802641 RepID=UPI001BEE95EC|nr:LysR family transcriptional regulator [Kutzneria sp. CA-103260]QUQ66952.1 LysR family transcriptional regulator [Kutzneria sp. CA-103260]